VQIIQETHLTINSTPPSQRDWRPSPSRTGLSNVRSGWFCQRDKSPIATISDLAYFALRRGKSRHGQSCMAKLSPCSCVGTSTCKQLATVRLFSPYQSREDHFCGENDRNKDKSVRKEVKPLGTLLSGHHWNSPRFDATMGTRDSFEQSTLEMAAATPGGLRYTSWTERPNPCLDASVVGTMRLAEVKVDHYLFNNRFWRHCPWSAAQQGTAHRSFASDNRAHACRELAKLQHQLRCATAREGCRCG